VGINVEGISLPPSFTRLASTFSIFIDGIVVYIFLEAYGNTMEGRLGNQLCLVGLNYTPKEDGGILADTQTTTRTGSRNCKRNRPNTNHKY